MFGWILGFFGFIWNGIQAGFDAIVAALEWSVGALKGGLLAAWRAVRFAWDDVLKPVGRWLDDAYQRLRQAYTDVIKPGLDWLQRVTDALRRVYATFLQPILSTIEQVRRILKLLELLHVQFAAQLDAALGKLEQKLSLPLQLVISEFNKLTSRVEGYVLTADNLFVRVTQLQSIGRDIQAIRNISWNYVIKGIPPEKKKKPDALPALTPAAAHVDTFDQSLTDDTIGDGIDMAGAVALFDDSLAA